MMKKVQFSEIMNFGLKSEPIETDKAIVLPLVDGSFLKLYKDDYLKLNEIRCVDLEAKLVDSFSRKFPSEIKSPKVLVYNGNKLIGEITEGAKGISFTEWYEQLIKSKNEDLESYARVYSKLEELVGSTKDIVYPDICSYDNIFVSDNGKRIELIDYDGLQVGKYPTLSFSSGLGSDIDYYSSKKYCVAPNYDSLVPMYTKELDIRSLIFFFYRTVFNVDLRTVSDGLVSLDDVAWVTNLNDPDIMHKVWKVFQENETNEWLGEDVLRLAMEYKLNVIYSNYNKDSIKRLVRK